MGFVANREIWLLEKVVGPGFETIKEKVFVFPIVFMQVSRFSKKEPSFVTQVGQIESYRALDQCVLMDFARSSS